MPRHEGTTIEVNSTVIGRPGSRSGTLVVSSAEGENLAHVEVREGQGFMPTIALGQGTATELSSAQLVIDWLTPWLVLAVRSLKGPVSVEDCSVWSRIRLEVDQ